MRTAVEPYFTAGAGARVAGLELINQRDAFSAA
jgi:hypothetical protein